MQVVIFSSPGREEMLCNIIREFQGYDVAIIGDQKTFGTNNFWKRWEQARQLCLNSPHDNYLILSDDGSRHDIEAIKKFFKEWKDKPFTCQIISDYRETCWGSEIMEDGCYHAHGYDWIYCDFFDCGGLTNRATLSQFEVTKPRKGNAVSSGVGRQITEKLRALNVAMYKTSPSLSYHGNHPSVMHPEERKRQPLVTVIKRQKVVMGIATFGGREKYLEKTIESLQGQCDHIYVYDNERMPDLTDNGKFYGLIKLEEPCYYLTGDDDIIYPPTYVEDMKRAIDLHGCIVTHHGRKLLKTASSYYRGHKHYGCLHDVINSEQIDVAGTGVAGWHTSYWNPKDLHKSEDKKMSDLVFSLAARKAKKRIMVLQHRKGYIVDQHVPAHQTIYGQEHKRDHRQTEIANEIINLPL